MKNLSHCKRNVEKILLQWFLEHPFAKKPLVRAAKEYTLRGGKRIRACILLKTYWSARQHYQYEQVAWELAAIMELLQSYLLIHDDWMDDDSLRRGKPTLHVFFQKDYDQKTAERLAILTGNFLHAFAMKKIIHLGLPASLKETIGEEISSMLEKVIYGQTLDITHTLANGTMRKYYTMIRYKTAVYSFEAPIALGLLLAGKQPMQHFRELGTLLGIAFQMQDDYLDVMSEKIGKDNLSDMRQGKANALTLLLWQSLSQKEKNYVLSLQGKKITKKDIIRVQQLVKKYHLDILLKQRIDHYFKKAQQLIKKLPLQQQEPYKEILTFLQEREY